MKRFLIVGCGKIAARHASIIRSVGSLIAVCDVNFKKAIELASMYDAKPFNSLEEMIQVSSADFLVVCTPNGLHAAHSILGLESGLHVICEKPMALRSADCKQMILASENTGKKLFVVKQNRYNPPVVFVNKLIQKKSLGKLLSIQMNGFWNRNDEYYSDNWRGTKELDGGILFTQFSHFIDLIYGWMGSASNSVGFARNYLHQNCTEFPDTIVATLQFNNGAIGSIHFTTNAFAKNAEGSVTIIGEKGILKIGGAYLNNLEYVNVEGIQQPKLLESNPANQYGNYEGSMSNHPAVYEYILHHVLNDSLELTNMYDSMKTVEMIEMIEQSFIVSN